MQNQQARRRFGTPPVADRTHVLMITNHGVHEWNVVPGLPDTGGQNVYVNQLTEALVAQGYRVTIANRGGYPHPQTGAAQSGVVYHPSGYARIIYLEDDRPEFVRKEDMDGQIPRLVEDLTRSTEEDNDRYDLIISHYWDAGKIGVLFNRGNGAGQRRLPHLWVPHSLGALKKHNMHPSTWADLRIDERITNEKELLKSLDGVVATSTAIRDTLKNDYGYEARYFLPPCVDELRYRPRSNGDVEPIWEFLADRCALTGEQLKRRKIVTEISRTDKTKRKDVLIRAFARVKEQVPEALLLVSIDPHAEPLHGQLLRLVKDQGLANDVIVLGSVWEQLPLIYNVTSLFCTPSVMEGFGMSAQEAAASGKPVVSSDLVPFVCEYLLGNNPERVAVNGRGVSFGRGGVVVPADFVEGFAEATIRLLKQDDLRQRMGAKAREITVPYFTWQHMTTNLLGDLGLSPDRRHDRLAGFHVHPTDLGLKLLETWQAQARDGFLLTDPAKVRILTHEAADEVTGVTYRFRWMPHREIRGDIPELERRGILNPNRDSTALFRDPRDPYGRHCFLCKDNVIECHPMEVLVPVTLADRKYYAGANFAWIEPDHFTVMAAEHIDQAYSPHVLEAMLDLHVRTAGRFRVLFNGPEAGATIPWHLHYQITTAEMPIERLHPACEEHYPTALCRFHLADDGLERANRTIEQWLAGDTQQRSVNILIASPGGDPSVFVFPRDQRHATAEGKGLVGGFEVAGDFVLSAPSEEETFRNASVARAAEILSQVYPPDWSATAAA